MALKQNFDSGPRFQQGSTYFERLRLCRLLEEAMHYPLVTVYAGAGYGKTRLVYNFLQDYKADITWVQLSERDNMETRFWENFTHVVSLTKQDIGGLLSQIAFPMTDEAFEKIEQILVDVGERPKKHILVCDDFHLLQNPDVIGFFKKIVHILPPNMTLILISRTTPDIDLVKMMVHERVFSIRENSLRFTEDEIAGYLNQLEIPGTGQSIRDIYDDTQGWAFAVNLIGRALNKGMAYERYALEAMKANIFKLIETELSRSVSEPLFRVLLKISLIEHLAAGLIKKLIKDDYLVKDMEQLNAYIRYDSFLGAYVIHHLFLDYLKQESHVLSDEEKKEVYSIAAAWCEENEQYADALSYYEKFQDYDSITRIIATLAIQMPQDMARYALEIFERAPEDVALRNPIFVSMMIKLKINLGQFSEASGLAEKYIRIYEAQPDSPERNRAITSLYAIWGLLRMNLSTYTDVYDFYECYEKMGEYYDKNPFKIYGSYESLQVSAWASLVGTNRAEAHEEYINAMTRIIPYVSHVLNKGLMGFDDLIRGELCFYRGEFNNAEKHLKQSIEKARANNQFDTQNRALVYLMQIDFSHGDFKSATLKLEEMETLLDKKDYDLRYKTYDIAYGFYQLALMQPDMVPDWLKKDFSPFAHPSAIDNYANRVKAQYHYQTRQYSTLLAFVSSLTGQVSVLFGHIGLYVLEALILYQFKDRENALASLTEAYRLAEPSGIINPFVEYGKDMRTLTAFAMKEDKCVIPLPWLENINRKSSAYAKRKAQMLSEYRIANQIEDEIILTAREMEVLKDLTHGLSRTEIAAHQNISTNTVKMVTNILYDKLSANNLAEAIHMATERKLI